MCGGWLIGGGVLVLLWAGAVVVTLQRALEQAEEQVHDLLAAQARLSVERDHLFDQVNRLQEARLDRELVRLEEGDGAG